MPRLRAASDLARRTIVATLLVAGTAACDRGEPISLLSPADAASVDSLLADTAHLEVDGFGYHIDRLDRRHLIALLEARRYETLDSLLEERWQAVRGDVRHEARLYHAFEAFYQGNAAIQEALEKWVEARPTAHNASFALAYYRYGRASNARGGASALGTSDEQFAEMRYHVGVGSGAAREGLWLAPDHLIGHFVRLNFLRLGGGDGAEAREIVEGALQSNPTSHLISRDILTMLEPRWGGSVEYMDAFVKAREPLFAQNAKLRTLQAAVSRQLAGVSHEDHARTLELLDESAFWGADYFLFLEYGETYRHLGRWVDALRAYHRAIKVAPQGRTALQEHAKVLIAVGAMIEDRDLRDRVWAEAERRLLMIRELRQPDAGVPLSLARLATARARCRLGPPPCFKSH